MSECQREVSCPDEVTVMKKGLSGIWKTGNLNV